MHKEATIEEIAEYSKKNYSTILRATHQLVKRGFINVRFERTALKGKELRYYALSFRGLIIYWSRNLDRTEVSKIAKAHEDMLLVFGKWETFVRRNLEGQLFDRLVEAVNFEVENYAPGYSFVLPTMLRRTSQLHSGPTDSEIFDAAVLGFVFMDSPVEYVQETQSAQWDALEKIWIAVDNDYLLRKKRDEFLSYLDREHKEGVKAIHEWRKYLFLNIFGRH